MSKGPLSGVVVIDLPGYDFIIQAQGGIMSITGPMEGPPMKVGVAIVDVTAGLFAAIAILAALYEREHSGRGISSQGRENPAGGFSSQVISHTC